MSDIASVLRAIEALGRAPNVTRPTDAELRQAAERYGTRTAFGNYVFHTMVKNRSSGATVYVGSSAVQLPSLTARQQQILKALPQTLALV